MKAMKGWVSGRVQGVSFRFFVKTHADKLGIKGNALNTEDGRVEFLLIGEEESVDRMIEYIRSGPELAKVEDVFTEAVEVDPAITSFKIGWATT